MDNKILPQFGNVFITGDLHLGDGIFHFEKRLVEILKSNDFDCVIFGGDTFDQWRCPKIEKLIARYNFLFDALRQLSAPVVFIRGNHDRQIDYLKNFNFEVCDSFQYISSTGKKIKVIHGHQFDGVTRHFEFFSRKMIYLEERINRFLRFIKLNKELRLTQKAWAFNVFRAVRNFYEKINSFKNVDTLVFGHLHVPWEGAEKQIDFYNWGGWQRDFGLPPQYIQNVGAEFKLCEVK